ncbi:MAG: transglycosylase SLT domain-containing protein, partial [Actinomycetota bacterium]|nr:transglycosylase SLT domain-containing protein [Actinomycetota bacterium]
DVGTAMSDAATALNDVATALTGAKTYISTRCDQALTEISTWTTNHPNATTEEFDAMTRGVCSSAASDINTHLEGTEQTLSSALGKINGAKSPASKFSSLSQPNTQPFTPQSGEPIEWKETPPQTTNPSSTENGNNQQPSQNNTSQSTGTGSSNGSGSSTGGGGGGGGGGLGPSGGPPVGGPPPGNVKSWIDQAIEILRQHGINVGPEDAQRIWQIIQHESGGNPHAINNWDSNAAKGTPSKGLMQCIDPTFDAYKLPGTGNIWDPVANICAGVNYAISRYGSLANVPGIKATESGGGYVGY